MGERSAQWMAIALVSSALAVAFVWIVNVQQHQNDALSALICHAEKVVRKSPGITEKQRQQALHFYKQQIRLEHLKPCK